MKIEFEEITIKTCCGAGGLILILNQPITTNFLALLCERGFIELKHFTISGIFYMENQGITINGAFNQNRMQVNCKSKSNCKSEIESFKQILQSLF